MAETTERTAVLSYYRYVPWSQNPHGTHHFCGACEQSISGGSVHGGNAYFSATWKPADLLAAIDEEAQQHATSMERAARLHAGAITMDDYMARGAFSPEAQREYRHIEFCPWCGAQFEDEWWKRENVLIRNERTIDHFKNPGWHPGDSHEFRSDSPDMNAAAANHWLGVSGGDKLCWCDPEVEPGPMGCVIRHRNVDYHDYLAAEQAKDDQRRAREADEGDDNDDW
jgi:hypothetical protein